MAVKEIERHHAGEYVRIWKCILMDTVSDTTKYFSGMPQIYTGYLPRIKGRELQIFQSV
jgi:hypothetical protein